MIKLLSRVVGGFSVVMGQQLIDVNWSLDEQLEENGISANILEADVFDVYEYRAELMEEIDDFRDRYDTNLPNMFRKAYVKAINEKLREDTKKFFIEKAYNNVSQSDFKQIKINLDYELSEKDLKTLETEMISKYWVLNEYWINSEIKIFKNLTHRTNEELSNKVIVDRFLELRDETFQKKFDDKEYRRTYIKEARQQFLDKAIDQYMLLKNVMIKDAEKGIEEAYMSWLEHYDRLRLLNQLNDVHELNLNSDIKIELPADLPDYT